MAEKTAPPPEFTPLQRLILESLREEIEPIKPTVTYKLALLGVACVNLLLPLLYLGLILLVAHALYWNWRYHGMQHWGGWIVHVGIYLLAGVTLVFLIKPLFARDSQETPPLKIKPSAEPFLFEYVAAICKLVNAPTPATIRLVCEPNAAASFSRGLMGLFTGRMELTIGLPLVTGMSVRQLTGVLAHEFGHFSQGGGMRLSFIVRHINAWLVKIVFLRDAWDEKLVELSRSGDPRTWPALWATRFCVFLSRQLLFGLVWAGNVVSCYLMRQMEYDADRYEARTVGFRVFTSSFSRLMEMSIAHQMAFHDLERFHSEGRLPDNFPALIASNVSRITPELRKAFRKLQLTRQTELFDSHPSDRDRIDSARQENAAGVFQLGKENPDPPATVLFANLDRICRGITLDFYQTVLGKSFKKSLMHPVQDLLQRREDEAAAGKCLDRYFQVHIPVDRPLPLHADSLEPPARPQEALQNLKDARERMLAALPEYKPLPERYETALEAQFTTNEALSVLESGLRYRGREFGLPDNRADTAKARFKRVRAAVQHLAARMLVFETAASERLSAALRLLQVPKVAAAIPEGAARQKEVRTLVTDGILISEMISELPELRLLFRRSVTLLARLGDRRPQKVIDKIVGQLEEMSQHLQQIHERLKGKPYSFDHADSLMTLQEFAIPHVPEPMDIDGLVGACQQMSERLCTLQIRIFGRLTQIAEKVEGVLGLPPLPDLESQKPAKDTAAA